MYKNVVMSVTKAMRYRECQKYSVTVIFYYIFHVKPHFLKTLYCIFDVQNFVLCLNRELIKIIGYKFMLKLQCKTTFNSVFVGKKIIKIEQESTLE
jgi:5'(3')-deoxyribonucleotidase